MKRVLVMAACLVLTLPAVSRAGLIQIDALAIGDGLITQDTGTGLEWLDLTFTTNISYIDMNASLVSDPFLSGFRRASAAEVNQLLVDAGFVTFGVFDPANVAAAQLMTAMLGDTFAVFGPEFGRQGAMGMTSDNVGGALPVSTSTYFTDTFSGLTGYGASPDGSSADWAAFSHIGHFLVREGDTTDTTGDPVPEPASMLLLGSGVVLAVRRRFRA